MKALSSDRGSLESAHVDAEIGKTESAAMMANERRYQNRAATHGLARIMGTPRFSIWWLLPTDPSIVDDESFWRQEVSDEIENQVESFLSSPP
jgi:hypothetical protein